jgi:hypothetical protein
MHTKHGLVYFILAFFAIFLKFLTCTNVLLVGLPSFIFYVSDYYWFKVMRGCLSCVAYICFYSQVVKLDGDTVHFVHLIFCPKCHTFILIMPETLKYDFYVQIDGESFQGLRIGIHKCFFFICQIYSGTCPF